MRSAFKVSIFKTPIFKVGVFGFAALVVSVSSSASADVPPGTKASVDLSALAKPGDTPSKANPSQRISKPANARPTVPAGFSVNAFAEGLSHARNMAVAPNGDVLLVESNAGKITLLRDADGDGKAEKVSTFADGFRSPYGIALGKDALYLGDLNGAWRIPYTAGDVAARAKPAMITAEGAFGAPSGHNTRNVTLSPDGTKLYVAIGSQGNIAEEPMPRATIQVFTLSADGTKATDQRTFASGLRNPVGTVFYPGTDDLYTVVNERDALGDELVPDYLTRVADNGFYGWPYSYMGKNPQPGFADKRPDLVAKAIVPDVPFRSHSAPLGFAFYTAQQFPKEYQGGAFVALHGSWNAADPRGYNVVYVPFENKKPVPGASYTVFAAGFWASGRAPAQVWGRPAGIAVANDGSLLIADDGSNTVWRVSYTGR